MSIGDGRKTYSDSTLKSMTKDELINIIRCLESNLRNAHETNDIQYENCKRLLSEERNKILGITFTFLSFLYWFIIDKDE